MSSWEGFERGAGISLFVVDSPPGGGPALHRHEYEEVFVVHEGQVQSDRALSHLVHI